jgi:hypothetical protein
LRGVLDDPRNDQTFIANVLLNLAPAVDMELTEEYQGFCDPWHGEVSVPPDHDEATPLILPPKRDIALDQYREGSKLYHEKTNEIPCEGGIAFGRHAN